MEKTIKPLKASDNKAVARLLDDEEIEAMLASLEEDEESVEETEEEDED